MKFKHIQSVIIIGLLCCLRSFCSGQSKQVKTFALESYSFNKLLNDKIKGRAEGISLMDFLKIAADNQFDAVSITGYFFPSYPKVPTDEEINQIKHEAGKLKLPIVSLGVRNDFATTDQVKLNEDINLVKDWIDVAVKLGSPVVRVFSGAALSEEQEKEREKFTEQMVKSMRICAEYAQKKGVRLVVQNHGDFLQTADQTINLVKKVNSKSFGVLVDTGYFLVGDAYSEIDKVMPYAFNFLLKENIQRPNDPEAIDLNKISAILKKYNYNGNIVLETIAPKRRAAAAGYNPYQAVPNFYQQVKKAIK
ncbi:Xylose isomerase domain-containing protein TIM barrel [Pseudopedobacter saltans DSM 12145]|uniref:Xylose isomerase domain-containing protein TIM barrel n=1 Tax=Pseudopedobacter saltans (strain ATCC 51119 / DSM 12145 / JCM 21818 / CCUG 39354 / LMG 10337 / NBRC 100064 / NCIMB 13643) TaxID=762903 RepID=F0SBR9_PSESL|nr:sugar phosphate isomerase/epimerase family protein [Pseudopedobacter saltans]ADY52760.1 Xylose isomerase domain-containing protein TIM barrel [Pseudopedobacter saltans DSM 12145]